MASLGIATIKEDIDGDPRNNLLRLEQGEEVEILDENNSPWIWARNTETDEKGYVMNDKLLRKKSRSSFKQKDNSTTQQRSSYNGYYTVTQDQMGNESTRMLQVELGDMVEIVDDANSTSGFVWVKDESDNEGYVSVSILKKKKNKKSFKSDQPRGVHVLPHGDDPLYSSDESNHSYKSRSSTNSKGSRRSASFPDESNSKAKTIYNDFKANMRPLRKLLDQDGIRDLPIVVVPVAGEFRTGKSFLLSYFLRYLKMKDFGDEREKLIGFDHANSDQPVTQGIRIWSEPLIVEERNKKVLVLLMDSQGIFNRKDKEEATRVFALTTIISSLMIFNLSRQLNEAVLGQLKLFSAYAMEATTQDTDEVPFQKLTLLIRDWEKAKPAFGFDGGKEYCRGYFMEGDEDSDFGTYFRDFSCYLMPHPGDVVKYEGYDGSLRRLSGDFKIHMMKFIQEFFDINHLLINRKKVAGDPITAGEFCDYFERCTQMLDDVNWNQPSNMLEMNASFKCEIAKNEALALYAAYMDKETNSSNNKDNSSLMTEEKLKEISMKAGEEVKNKYKDLGSFARKNARGIYDDGFKKLEKEIDESFGKYKKMMDEENNKKRELEQSNQAHWINEAKRQFTDEMEKETALFKDEASGTIISKDQLQRNHSFCVNKVLDQFEEKIKASGNRFTEMNTENLDKLKKDLKDTLPEFEEKLENAKMQHAMDVKQKEQHARDNQMQHETQKQIEAKYESKKIYTEQMGKLPRSFVLEINNKENSNNIFNKIFNNLEEFTDGSSNETFMTEKDLQRFHEGAITKALEKYDKKTLENGTTSLAIFSEQRIELVKELKEEFIKYTKQRDQEKTKWEMQEWKRKMEMKQNRRLEEIVSVLTDGGLTEAIKQELLKEMNELKKPKKRETGKDKGKGRDDMASKEKSEETEKRKMIEKKKKRSNQAEAVGIELGVSKSYIAAMIKNDTIINHEVENDLISTEDDISDLFEQKITKAITSWGDIKKAVIPIPTYYTKKEKDAIIEAADGKLEILDFITNPAAAAISSSYSKKDCKNILLFDLGHTKSEVTVLSKGDTDFEALESTTLDYGEQKIVDLMVKYCAQSFQMEHDEDLDDEAKIALRDECRDAIIKLSTRGEACVEIDNLYKDNDFSKQISQRTFQFICKDLFKDIQDDVINSIEAQKRKSDIQEIIIVGDSTNNNPQLKKALQDIFEENKLKISFSTEVYADGAAVMAAKLIDY